MVSTLLSVVLFDSLHYSSFLHSEVNQIIQHIIVQNQDGQNNNTIISVALYHPTFSDARGAQKQHQEYNYSYHRVQNSYQLFRIRH